MACDSSAGAAARGVAGACAGIDDALPREPTIPPVCATLIGSFAITPGTPPSEASLDTARIQS